MNRRKLYALATVIGFYFKQDKPNEEIVIDMTSIDNDTKEIEQQVKQIVIDNKVANDKYNKEQMKYRKRFHK